MPRHRCIVGIGHPTVGLEVAADVSTRARQEEDGNAKCQGSRTEVVGLPCGSLGPHGQVCGPSGATLAAAARKAAIFLQISVTED